MKDIDVVVVGELNADLILTGTDITPEFEQAEKLVDDSNLTLGSSAAIFACGAARLGLRVAFIGKVGHDEFGSFVTKQLEAQNIDTTGVVVDPRLKTGLSVIFSMGHDRAILTYLGSIAALHYEEIDLALLARARHLHLGSYFLLQTLRPDIPKLFDCAHAHELTISLDTNYDPSEQWNDGLKETLDRTDIFLPNETELLAISGLRHIEPALAALNCQGPLVVTKLGSRGAVARHQGQVIWAEPFPVSVVDTIGAGDSFDAGFVYGYLSNWDLQRCLRLACVCGALSTRASGGTATQPTLAEAIEVL